MASTCKYCKAVITWPTDEEKAAGAKLFPRNANGSPHNCRKTSPHTPTTGGGSQKPQALNKVTRWEGIRIIKEVKAESVNDLLQNGWVILDRVERIGFRIYDISTGGIEVPLLTQPMFNSSLNKYETPPTSAGQKATQTISESIYIMGTR